MPKPMGQHSFKRTTWRDYVLPWEFENGEWHEIRPFGLVWSDAFHAIETKNGKRYREYCHGYDVDNDEFFEDREERCECCRLGIKVTKRYYVNVISVEAEEGKPENPKPDWTPVRLMEMASTLFERVCALQDINKGFPVTHPDKGGIIHVKFDKDADPANMYQTSMAERNTPLSDEQREYSVVQRMPDGQKKRIKPQKDESGSVVPGGFIYPHEKNRNSLSDMKDSLKRHGYYKNADVQKTVEKKEELEFDDDDDGDEEKEAKAAKAAEDTPVSEMPSALQGEPDFEEEDEEPAPRPSKKKAKKAKKEPEPSFDDEDEDDEV